jgi:hypothetical protein
MCASGYAPSLKFEKETDIIWISVDYQTKPIEDTPLFKDGEETGSPYLDASNILPIIAYNGLAVPHHPQTPLRQKSDSTYERSL